MDLLSDLNDAQREAVTTTEGHVRVVAGAGSGKTRALTRRFAYLVQQLGIAPGRIMCVTFTNKAAGEMRERIHQLIGDEDTGYINTFHGFCVTVLQEDSNAVQYPKSFLVLDNDDIDSMLAAVYEERGLTLRDMTYARARDMIEVMKLFRRPDYYNDMISMSLEDLRNRYDRATKTEDIIFYGYLYQERKCFALDYNDLLKFTVHIFQKNPDICLKWQKRLEYVMVDEFQDIDWIQYQLMKLLCGHHHNLFVVGDSDQTIYSWRGADGRYLMDFDKDFPGTRTIMMMDNYRSTPQIVAVANSLISHNVDRIAKVIIPTLPGGAPVVCHYAASQEDEAAWICQSIKDMHMKGCALRDITVLYRAHYVTRSLEMALIQAKIPYAVYSGVRFFGRREVKDALCYLRMVAYRDDVSFRRVVNTPRRNMGRRRMEALEEYATVHSCSLFEALEANLGQPLFKGTGAAGFVDLVHSFDRNDGRQVSELLGEVLERSGYERMLRTEGAQDRLDNLAELRQSVHDYETTCGEETTLMDYLSHVALFTNADAEDRGDKVRLMTVHAAKGLEFPHVFLCAMNEGVFPSRKVRTPEGMEEERRLAFVAITRAQKTLHLSEADGFGFDGSVRYPSRFLLEIDRSLLQFTHEPDEGLIRRAGRYIESENGKMAARLRSGIYMPGQRVLHPVFGPGTVLEVDEELCAHVIRFDSMPTARTISFKVHLGEL